MNQKLQNILDIIQQSEKLDAEQKDKLLQAVKDADKELEITAFKLERTEKVKKTTAILLEETIEELEQKRKAVEAQNRELEIEASLERVRAQAMGMTKADDLLNVCEVLFKELEVLGFEFLRNSMVAVFNDDEVSFQSYDYSDHLGRIHSVIPYKGHRSIENFLRQVRKSSDAFSEVIVSGLEVQELKNQVGEEDDSRLKNNDKIYYYFYSIGLGAIGISTFKAIDKTQLKILKRFRNVFDLAYRRYNDIELAATQAREAQIEASLERVRAVAMSMNKSDDLLSICEVSFNEFKKLGFNNLRNSLINIFNDEEESFVNYDYSDYMGGSISNDSYNSNPANEEFLIQIRKANDAFVETVIERNQLDEWKEFRRNHGEEDDPRLDNINALYYYNYSIGSGSIGISNFEPISEEQKIILKRFRNVFNLSYQRYLDIALAEAQAREAQIEASLERVRAVAMSMNKSDDLLSICEVSFKEFKKLGFDEIRNALIHIQYDEQKYFMDYDFSDLTGGAITKIEYGSHPIVEDYLRQIRSAKDAFYQGVIKEDQLEEWKNFRKNSGQIDDPRLKKATALYYYFFSIGVGDIGISTLKSINESQIKILKRFRNVFDLAYRRYNDISIAEQQARETQVQLALERVRARTMAMHKSEELSETSFVLFEQLKELGEVADQISIMIYNEKEKVIELYATIYGNQWEETGTLPFEESSVHKKIYAAWKEKKKSIVIDLSGDNLDEFNNFKMKYSKQYKSESELPKKRWVVHNAFFSKGVLTFSTQEPRPAETIHLLERFAGVFDLTYTRFLDLQKAEAQAREAQIEAALERVRASSMAMHNSNDVGDATAVMFTELEKLGIETIRCGVDIMDTSKIFEVWASTSSDEGKVIQIVGKLDSRIHQHLQRVQEAWERQDKFISSVLEGQDLEDYYKKLSTAPDYRVPITRVQSNKQFNYDFFFKEGGIFAYRLKPFTEDEIMILQRFTSVFGLTFRRYLDLKNAEAQAREAEIEAALERVRSRTMAMQKSDELAETASHLFDQLNVLGIKPYRFNIAIVDSKSDKCQLWSTTNEGKVIPTGPLIPLKEYNVFNQMYDGWKQQKSVSVIRVEGDERIEWTKYIMRYVSFNEYKPENIDLERLRHEPAIFSNFFFKQGFVVVHTIEEINESDMKIIQRFVNVFEQTYTRFLDLQRAEEQTREAKIEASLERVRSKAMAMHNPNDLSATVNVFFKELKTLGIIPIRCGVGQIDETTRTTSLTTTTSAQQGDSFQVIGKVKQTGHPVLDGIFDHWKMQKEYYPVLEGEDIKAYYDVMNPQIGYPDYPEGMTQYGNNFPFKEGFVFAWTENKLSQEELQIFRRFTSVLSLTYRRYIDLKAAEVRAFESVRQASLDRVRAEIASMRTSEDLNHITPIIWRELKNLEVPFFRCGVYIVDEKTQTVQVYLTTPDGKSLGVLNLSFDSNEITSNTVDHWRKNIVYKTHWDREEFIEWTKSMMHLGQIQSAETYQGSTTPPESLYLHFVPFAQGMLYVGDVSPLEDEKLELVKILAEAFSIAYARYEDFKNLEDAKNKIEITLNELKAAQAQLVHSEKMASLGELTAGIAHEIKNPLNFVNNFSEVSRELLDEMKIEIENKNIDEVIELIEDLKQNLDKINQHGKRADSIVKGMLLHSRGTSGEKTPTDINDLLDQYVNLAYHGMRATNKEFNITIEKDYDASLEKINVVPQDISRVFLNIINNACYAAYDKKKRGENNFSPTLRVSTKKVNNRVEIKIGDNGNGIPADHLDKIFQPFFTTKPSGEGTGLGLSLSYDIVTKVHGGELKVLTKEGEGTDFIIILVKS